MSSDFSQYYEAREPGRRERAYGWATAIGLQAVDGLSPSQNLIETARRHIEGEISAAEARRLVDAYYETRLSHDAPTREEEADKVAARICEIIYLPSFRLSPEYLIGLHGKIFEGVFPHAGKIREVDLTKREWVLDGESVHYEASFFIEKSLDYDFGKEAAFKYKGLSENAFVEHFASFISGIWQIHPFREGNTRTTALFAIKYLRSKGFAVTNDLFAENSWYFRNALVRANYENQQRGIEKTQLPLEEFFKVLIYGYDIELKSRHLKIGQEYGSPVSDAIKNLHRHGAVTVEKTVEKPVENAQAIILSALEHFPTSTQKDLQAATGLSRRGVEWNIKSLKDRGLIRRVGPSRGGHWEVNPT